MTSKLVPYLTDITGVPHIALQGNQHNAVKQLSKLLVEKAKSDPQRLSTMTVVLVGLPNVGKSSLTNALRFLGVRKGQVSEVAPFAGVTKSIQSKVKIHSDPDIFVVDTPGVLDPHIISPSQALRVALVGSTKDTMIHTFDKLVEYVLFRLNQSETGQKRYMEVFQLNSPVDDVTVLLDHIIKLSSDISTGQVDATSNAVKLPLVQTREQACLSVITLFRKGQLGKITLDDCSPEGCAQFLGESGMRFMQENAARELETDGGRIVFDAAENEE
ncbi:Mitochondrial GTPase [Entophlyctis luteolus]|nr:Mitochondrial GTPase [Entophlyctis luteolus]